MVCAVGSAPATRNATIHPHLWLSEWSPVRANAFMSMKRTVIVYKLLGTERISSIAFLLPVPTY